MRPTRLLPFAFVASLSANCVGIIGDPASHSIADAAGATDGATLGDVSIVPQEIAATPLLRLSRVQYDNIAGDLLHATFVPSSVLSTDEKEGPFDVNAQTRMSRGLAEQYQFVAERLGTEVEAGVQTHAPCSSTTGAAADACATMFIESFGRRAFRRPLSSDEGARWAGLFHTIAMTDGYATGIRTVVEAMLQSPNFIYRLELLPSGTSPVGSDPYVIDAFARASRLSFLLWNSAPDDALLDAAAHGQLETAAAVQTQADRMLADPRALRTMQAFATAWADLDGLEAATTPARLGGLDPTLVPLMRDETVRFVDYVLRRGDGRLSTLLTADFSLADTRLASAVYGVDSAPDARGLLHLDPLQRAGILTQASVLFAHSHAGQTSPVLRGKWVREVLLCQKVPDPPANVNATPPAPVPGQTTRERYLAHRTNPSCSGCHSLLDDLGFGLEGYDPVGRWRALENGMPVNVTGTITHSDVDGDFMGAPDLSRRLANSHVVSACFARQWFRYGLGRPDGPGESNVVTEMSDATRTGGGFPALVRALIRSEAFLQRRSP